LREHAPRARLAQFGVGHFEIVAELLRLEADNAE
jgi:hypothetical protein